MVQNKINRTKNDDEVYKYLMKNCLSGLELELCSFITKIIIQSSAIN